MFAKVRTTTQDPVEVLLYRHTGTGSIRAAPPRIVNSVFLLWLFIFRASAPLFFTKSASVVTGQFQNTSHHSLSLFQLSI